MSTSDEHNELTTSYDIEGIVWNVALAVCFVMLVASGLYSGVCK